MMQHLHQAAGPISFAAAFVAGVAGSVHCLAMCGGLSGALGMRARQAGAAPGRAFAHQLLQQLGRVGSYTLAGCVCGAFGAALTGLMDLAQIIVIVRVLAGACLIAIALRVLFGWRAFASLERLGARFFARLSPLARSTLGSGLGGSLLLGAIWGWLPCGLVYSMLIFAALSGSAWQGALILMLFGLGTWPAMLGGSLLSAQFWRLSMTRGVHTAAGVLLLAFGVLTMLAPLNHTHH